VATTEAVREYWDQHIHDLEITRHAAGSRAFFEDLDEYHFEKLHHLLRLVNFDGYGSQKGARRSPALTLPRRPSRWRGPTSHNKV
jgi:hypothetical protein